MISQKVFPTPVQIQVTDIIKSELAVIQFQVSMSCVFTITNSTVLLWCLNKLSYNTDYFLILGAFIHTNLR